MSRTLIIPDIHHRTAHADWFIVNVAADRIVFLGDYFDGHGDRTVDAERTAKWLRDSLRQANRTHLLGNHDLCYFVPGRLTRCSGYTPDKQRAILAALSEVTVSQFAPATMAGLWLASHAGVAGPLLGTKTPEKTIAVAKAGLRRLARGKPSKLFGVGYARGGSQPIGGLTWCDFDREFGVPIGRQILGHTPAGKPSVRVRWVEQDGRTLQASISPLWTALPEPAQSAANVAVCLDAETLVAALIDEATGNVRLVWHPDAADYDESAELSNNPEVIRAIEEYRSGGMQFSTLEFLRARLDAEDAEFDRLVARMNQPESARGVEALFTSTAQELGEAAVRGAERDRWAVWLERLGPLLSDAGAGEHAKLLRIEVDGRWLLPALQFDPLRKPYPWAIHIASVLSHPDTWLKFLAAGRPALGGKSYAEMLRSGSAGPKVIDEMLDQADRVAASEER